MKTGEVVMARAPLVALCTSLAPLGLCLALLSGCASPRPDQVEDLLLRAYRAAETHHEFELDPEAAVLLDAVSFVDPEFRGLNELREDLDPNAWAGVERSALGMNHKIRPRVRRTPARRALLWLPDRFLDLVDVVTVSVHMGTGAFADAHLTRALQASAGFRTTGGLGLHEHRSLGMKSQAETGVTLVAIGAQTYAAGLVGTSGTFGTADSSSGMHTPMSPMYQDLRDYWALGGSVTLGFFGAELDLHPLQLADFFAGFAGFDFLNDDFARTRGLRLDRVEARLLTELRRLESDRRALADYLEAKRLGRLTTGRPAPTAPPARSATPGSAPSPPAEAMPAAPARLP
jgi:hypothetical protein